MNKIILLLLAITLNGCATSQISKQEFMNDPVLLGSSKVLAIDYLTDQQNGGDGEQFGTNRNFLNLIDWKIYEPDYFYDGNITIMPSLRIRVKAENGFGGVSWSNYVIRFNYFSDLRMNGDRYNGLRIQSIAKE